MWTRRQMPKKCNAVEGEERKGIAVREGWRQPRIAFKRGGPGKIGKPPKKDP